MGTDFSKITPCGGDCRSCEHFKSGVCEGCLKNGGKCVHMWENGCRVFECCKKHNVKFCGLCGKFPCDYVKTNITKWDSGAIERLEMLGIEYRKETVKNG